MRLTQTSRVGINNDSPAYTLDVNGDIHANNIWIPGWYWCLFGNAWYSIDKSGSTAFWDQSSDQRLKRDITTIPDAAGALKQLRGVTFHWNEVGLQHLTRDIEKKWKSTSGNPEDDQKLRMAATTTRLYQM